LPEIVANLTLGGRKGNDLFSTATTSLYGLRVNVNGARYPRRQATRRAVPAAVKPEETDDH